jgi:hypothetical protein
MKTPSRAPAVEYRNPPAQPRQHASIQAPQTPAAPKQALAKEPQSKNPWGVFWGQFQGQRLVFQLRGGAVVEGVFAGLERGMIKLTDAVITGKQNRATVPWIIIEQSQVIHFHPMGVLESQQPAIPNETV